MTTTLLPLLALLHGLSATDPLTVRAGELARASAPQLEVRLGACKGADCSLIHLYLAAADPSRPGSTTAARIGLDSMHRLSPSPVLAALLGTAEALEARAVRGDAMAATRWVGKALDHLDEAVRRDSTARLVRILRIHSLVEVPEIFHVESRLREDAAALRSGAPTLAALDPSALLAIALVDYRVGNLAEASACWKRVASSGDATEAERSEARRRLEALRG
jgi:hypothetical protein